MTLEGQLKHDVMNALDQRGVFYMRMQSGVIKKGSRYIHLHPTGTADLLIFLAGRVLWCELKAPGQKTAKERAIAQAEFRAKVLEAGHLHVTAYSVEDVLNAVGLNPFAEEIAEHRFHAANPKAGVIESKATVYPGRLAKGAQ